MRRALGLGLAAALAVVAIGPTSAPALEKTSARMIDRGDDWNASTTAAIRYYNICTGWVWIWSGWSAGERMGVDFDTRFCPGRGLDLTWALTFSGVPSGYGFTGTIEVTQPGCGVRLAAQPYLPPITSGWNATNWGGIPVPGQFSVNIIWGAPSNFNNGTGLASDHPLPGPTGPAACGTCYPTTRVSNSRYYGVGGVYCPSGTTLSDGLCDVEWLIFTTIKCVVGVEPQSWGRIKGLYR